MNRFDSKIMIEKLRNKRLLFVGDSVNRNQWDSMMCMLHTSIPGDKKLGQGLNKTLYTFRSNVSPLLLLLFFFNSRFNILKRLFSNES